MVQLEYNLWRRNRLHQSSQKCSLKQKCALTWLCEHGVRHFNCSSSIFHKISVFIEHLFEHSPQPTHRFPHPPSTQPILSSSSANSATSSTILASAARFDTMMASGAD